MPLANQAGVPPAQPQVTDVTHPTVPKPHNEASPGIHPVRLQTRYSMADKNMRDKGAENQAEGFGKRVEGRAQNIAGSITGDDSEQLKGKAKELGGKAQQKLGKMQDKASRRDTD